MVGHGNQLPSTATYAMLDFMMKAHGLKNFHVSTIEGYPTLDATLLQLKETRPKSVTLVPLLLVCGNHTKEDIAGVWKTELEKQSYQVNVRMQGLGGKQSHPPALYGTHQSYAKRLITSKRKRATPFTYQGYTLCSGWLHHSGQRV